MPISKKTLHKWAKMLQIDVTTVDAAYDSADDTDVETPDVKVFTAEGLKKFEADKVELGRTAGVEVAVKTFKKEKGYDFPGKGLDDLANHLSSLTDTDGRVAKLQKSVEAEQLKAQQAMQKLEQMETRSEVHAAIPDGYAGYSKKELQAIAEANGFDFKKENGKIVPYRNGERIRVEATQADVPLSDALKGFFEGEKGMKIGAAPAGDAGRKGRGDGDGAFKGANTTSLKRSEIEKEWKEANPTGNVNGQEYSSHFATKLKEAKDAGQTVEMD